MDGHAVALEARAERAAQRGGRDLELNLDVGLVVEPRADRGVDCARRDARELVGAVGRTFESNRYEQTPPTMRLLLIGQN